MIDRSTAWALLSQRAGPTIVLAKMWYGNESDYLPIGSRLVTLEDEDFLPLIANMPHRFQEVDFWTREFSISDLSLEILNMPFNGSTRFSDLFDERGSGNDRGFENRQADVRLWKPGITTWEDCFDLFSVGLMRKPSTQGGIAIIEVQDQTFLTLQNIQLDRLTDADAADPNQGLPEGSRGKLKPRIYGNHTFLKGNDSKALDTVSSKNNGVPALYLGIDSAGDHYWQIAAYKVDELNTEGDDSEQQQIWGLDPDTKRHVRLESAFTIVQNDANGCVIKHPANPSFIDYWYHEAVSAQDSATGAVITAFSDIQRINSKDFSLAATPGSLENLAQTAGDWVQVTFAFPEWDNQSGDLTIDDVDFYWYGKLTFNGAADNTMCDITTDGGANPLTLPEGASYPDARIEDGANLAATLVGIADDVQVRLEGTAVAVNGSIDLDLYMGYKKIKYTPNQRFDLFFVGKGAEIDANWTNRAVVDGYDEQHADHGGSGNLGENPATLIEMTLRNEASLGNSRLNLNSFNTASNDVAGLVGAPVFLEHPDSYLQALFELVQQYRGFIWWTPEGELFLKILEDDYTTPNITIDGNLITNLTYGRTDINRLYTAVQMLYNEIAGENLLETTLVEDTTAQTWYNITQAESLRKQPAHGFNHNGAASIVSIGNYFLENQLNIHNTVQVQLPIMFNHIDIGGLVGFENLPEKLRGEDLSDSYTIAGQTIRPYFLINSVDRSDEIIIEGFQVHKLD